VKPYLAGAILVHAQAVAEQKPVHLYTTVKQLSAFAGNRSFLSAFTALPLPSSTTTYSP
jgi:hypothetical protein